MKDIYFFYAHASNYRIFRVICERHDCDDGDDDYDLEDALFIFGLGNSDNNNNNNIGDAKTSFSSE